MISGIQSIDLPMRQKLSVNLVSAVCSNTIKGDLESSSPRRGRMYIARGPNPSGAVRRSGIQASRPCPEAFRSSERRSTVAGWDAIKMQPLTG